ncbi:N-acetylmuramoyl-L-alanine amidase [bacterium]|nr:N-acetylmuramoyl-L-alanine amidase [bacterium]
MRKISIILFFIPFLIFGATHKIALDPAYGGTTNGQSYETIYGKNITLPMMQKANSLLSLDTADSNGGGEWNILMTRDDDTTISVTSRVEAANAFSAERYLNISINSYTAATANGSETYSKDITTPDKDLRDKVQARMVEQLETSNRGGKITTQTYYDAANMPVILIYPGFITNEANRNLMNSTDGHNKMGKAILYALQEHYGLNPYDPTGADDFTPPTITISSHTNNQTVTTSQITLTGSISDASAIQWVKINGTEVTYNSSNRTFSGVVNLTQGSNTITITSMDIASNEGTKTITINYAMQSAPVITVTYPSYGLIVNTQQISITGTVTDEDNNISIFKIGNQSVTLGTGGSFSYAVTLSQGDNEFILSARDTTGLESTATVFVKYEQGQQNDTTPPVITIASPTDNSTVNRQTLTVTGTVTDQSSIAVFSVNGEGSLLENGGFSHILDLNSGVNTITVYAEDSFGNHSSKSVIVTYDAGVEDTEGPIINITSPTNNTRTTIASINITGSVTDSSGVETFTVNDTAVQKNANGFFNHSATLTIGENRFVFKATDSIGNSSQKIWIIYLETQQNSGPTITVLKPTNNIVVSNPILEIKGTVIDGDGVQYLTINSNTVTVDNFGSFNFSITLVEGENLISINAADTLGNQSETQLNITYKKVTIESTDDGGCSLGFNNISFGTVLSIIFVFFAFIIFRKKESLK